MGNTFNTGRLINGLFTDASGNVGINTTSPSYKLDVTGTGRFTSTLLANGISSIGQEQAFTFQRTTGTASDLYSINADSGSAYLYNNTTSKTLMAWLEGGNVGIGTGSPTSLLTLAKDNNIGINTVDGSDNGYLAISGAGADGDNRGGHIYLSGNERGADAGTAIIASGSVGSIQFRTGASVERMRINSSGYVGIGTTNPSSRLTIIRDSPFNTGDQALRIRAINGDGYNLWFGASSNGYATIQSYRDEVGGAPLLLNPLNGGNVGIGTSSPSELLHIYSTAASAEIRLQTSSMSSYIRSQSNNLNFYIDNGERMRITNAGGIQIGSTAGPGSVDKGVFIGGFNNSFLNLYAGYSGGAAGMNITNSSNTTTIQFFGSSGNYYFAGTNLSDRRIKKNIKEISLALPNIIKLKPCTYTHNLHPNKIRGGFIAQEVLEVIPEFVSIPEDETEMMGVDYNGILALAVKAIQELKAEIEILKNK
jgi:hypothetical protein